MRLFYLSLLLLLPLLGNVSCISTSAGPIVDLGYAGIYQGFIDTYLNISSFLGIPYATPPLGSLRWASPTPYVPTSSIYPATSYRGSGQPEDVLYLNVFVPPSTTKELLPVRFWIHGGGFQGGDVATYPGGNQSALSGSIVVTSNYRLGIFGFLVFSELLAANPAVNFGMQDQLFALQWVHQHISKFGGDPDNVMIYGESAGAASVTILLTWQDAFPYYSKAALESPAYSGYTTSSSLSSRNDLVLRNHSSTLGCASGITLACMRNASAHQVASLEKPNSAGLWGYPTVDGYSLLDSPFSLFLAGKSRPDTPVLIGRNTNEGQGFAAQYYTSGFTSESSIFQLLSDQNFFPLSQVPTIAPIFGLNGTFSEPTLASFLTLYFVECGMDEVIASLVKFGSPSSPVWVYFFPYLNATHAKELPFVFDAEVDNTFLPPNGPAEKNLSNIFISYWTNFHKNGNPNGPFSMPLDPPQTLPTWPSFYLAQDNQVVLDIPVSTKSFSFPPQCQYINPIINLRVSEIGNSN